MVDKHPERFAGIASVDLYRPMDKETESAFLYENAKRVFNLE